jgi:hypothetical protein
MLCDHVNIFYCFGNGRPIVFKLLISILVFSFLICLLCSLLHGQINIVIEFLNIARSLTISFVNLLTEGPIVSRRAHLWYRRAQVHF